LQDFDREPKQHQPHTEQPQIEKTLFARLVFLKHVLQIIVLLVQLDFRLVRPRTGFPKHLALLVNLLLNVFSDPFHLVQCCHDLSRDLLKFRVIL
jgi:hypothetical protein